MARSTVAVKFTGDVRDLKRATGEAERDLGGFGSRMGPKFKAGLIAAGVAGGAALFEGLKTGLERDEIDAIAAASLGLDPETAEKLGDETGQAFGRGIGQSYEQIAEAATTALSEIGEEIDLDRLDEFAETASNIATVFGVDVASAVGTVGFLLRNDLVTDAEEGFGLVITALQRVPAAMRGELLDAISEYGVTFAALGLDGVEAFNLLLEAGQNTSVGIDKVGDAMKGLLERVVTSSGEVSQALEDLGLDGGAIANDLLAGGEVAQGAMDTIVNALLSIEDPAERARAAVAVFGEPMVDLSVDKIPQLLTQLGNLDGGLGDTEIAAGDAQGAMESFNSSLETDAQKIRSYERALKDAIATLTVDLLEGLESFNARFSEVVAQVLTGFETLINEASISGNAIADAFLSGLGNAGIGGILPDLPDISLPDIDIPFGDSDLRFPSSGDVDGNGDRRPIGARASGGFVSGGGSYVVGEEGPELFVPRSNGSIIPAGEFSTGGSTYNITINNPVGRPTEQSVKTELRRLQLLAM